MQVKNLGVLQMLFCQFLKNMMFTHGMYKNLGVNMLMMIDAVKQPNIQIR